MNDNIENYLIKIAKEKISDKDPSHDIQHAIRVLNIVKYIAKREGGDLEILIPGALFHDVICYPKDNPKSKFSAQESAEFAINILSALEYYPKEKIEGVYTVVNECSFSKGIIPNSLEGKILQEADRLEATGIISIMRTFSSVGQMGKKFYHPEDPFCKDRKPNGKEYGLDLFYERLLKVKDLMYTKTARKIAEIRTKVLHKFLKDFEIELYEDTKEL